MNIGSKERVKIPLLSSWWIFSKLQELETTGEQLCLNPLVYHSGVIVQKIMQTSSWAIRLLLSKPFLNNKNKVIVASLFMGIAKLLNSSIVLSLVRKIEIVLVSVEQVVAFLPFVVSALADLRAKLAAKYLLCMECDVFGVQTLLPRLCGLVNRQPTSKAFVPFVQWLRNSILRVDAAQKSRGDTLISFLGNYFECRESIVCNNVISCAGFVINVILVADVSQFTSNGKALSDIGRSEIRSAYERAKFKTTSSQYISSFQKRFFKA